MFELELHSLYLLYTASDPRPRLVDCDADQLTDGIQILQSRDYEENGPSAVSIAPDLVEESPLLSRRPAA